MSRHPPDVVVGERPALVPDDGEQLLGLTLQVGPIVVLVALAQAQLGVGPAGLLGRGDRLRRAPDQLAVQPEQRLEDVLRQGPARVHGGKPERAVEHTLLRALELDLECGARVRRLIGEELGELHIEGAREPLQLGQPRLPPAVLDEGELAACEAGLAAQLVERERALLPVVPDAPADGEQVHSFRSVKKREVFTNGSGEKTTEQDHHGGTTPRRSDPTMTATLPDTRYSPAFPTRPAAPVTGPSRNASL